MALDLQKYIGQITGQMQPMLDAFLKALGIRTEREQTQTLQKAQQMGRVTTGFLPEMQREVREEAGMEEAQFRGGYAQNIMQYAMQLFGLEKEYSQFQEELAWRTGQSELDRALQRELAKTTGRGTGRGDTTIPEWEPSPFIPEKLSAPDIPYGKFGRVGTYQPVAPKVTPTYKPTQKATTTYRGTRGGVIQ